MIAATGAVEGAAGADVVDRSVYSEVDGEGGVCAVVAGELGVGEVYGSSYITPETCDLGSECWGGVGPEEGVSYEVAEEGGEEGK